MDFEVSAQFISKLFKDTTAWMDLTPKILYNRSQNAGTGHGFCDLSAASCLVIGVCAPFIYPLLCRGLFHFCRCNMRSGSKIL